MRLSPEQAKARAHIRAELLRILNARAAIAAPGPRNLTELARKLGLRSSSLSAALSTGHYDILSPAAAINPRTLATALSLETDVITPQELWPDWK